MCPFLVITESSWNSSSELTALCAVNKTSSSSPPSCLQPPAFPSTSYPTEAMKSQTLGVKAVPAPQHHGVRAAQECLSTEQQEKCFPYGP